MSYVQFGDTVPVTDLPDDVLVARCNAERDDLLGVPGMVADAISNSPCVELEIRRKVYAGAENYGSYFVLGMLGLGIVGGLIGTKIFGR